MTKKALLQKIIQSTPSLDPALIQKFLSSMDPDHLRECDHFEIREHVQMSESLSSRDLFQVKITQNDVHRYKIVIIAFDYFSEFSIICGLISSFGLNIVGGNIQTLSSEKGRKKILDLFYVETIEPACFEISEQNLFKEALKTLIESLNQAHFREARSRVNKRLISHINQTHDETRSEPSNLKGLLAPIQIRFDNSSSTQWTILNLHGQDTPAFLYAFSNALAMRNIYIYKIKIHHEADKIHDRLYIANRQGKKITGKDDKKALQIAAVLIKQFIHFLAIAPDPAMAITHFDQFLDKILEMPDSRPLITFLKQKDTMTLLARFFGTSNFLWEDFLRIRFESLFPILEQFKRRPLVISKETLRRNLKKRLESAEGFQSKRQIVNDYKDEELFRIDLRHLHEPLSKLTDFSKALTYLAEVIVSMTLEICTAHLAQKHGIPRLKDGTPSPFTIFGLGKFGGRELGYASDIELLFVYGENGRTDGAQIIENSHYFKALTQEIVQFIETRQAGIFQIDTRLRPYGKSGQWAISFSQFESYYSETGKAAPFEKQALIKLRAIAGSWSLGKKCELARDHFVYNKTPWDKKEALELRSLQLKELVPKGRINVKYSPGALVEIEYLVQYLQLIHGHRISALHTPNTLEALDIFLQVGILNKETVQCLKENYLFLRSLIDALRIVRGNAKDLLLPDPDRDEFIFLARRMGFAKKNWQLGSQHLAEAISHNMAEVHSHFEDFIKHGPSEFI